MGVSGAHAAVVHAVQLPFDSLKSKLAREGNPKLPRVCDELGVGYRRTRVPIPATELHHLLALPPVYLKPNLRGFGVEPRGRGSPLREEPNLSDEVPGGMSGWVRCGR